VSDWKTGSKWEHHESLNDDKVLLVGKVLEFSPPKRLVLTWAFPEDMANEKEHTMVSLVIEKFKDVVHLTVTHDMLEPGSSMHDGIRDGWPKVMSNLKTFLETGKPLPMLW
jgi:uncharacterized protein YndB with AHSA1/START domain